MKLLLESFDWLNGHTLIKASAQTLKFTLLCIIHVVYLNNTAQFAVVVLSTGLKKSSFNWIILLQSDFGRPTIDLGVHDIAGLGYEVN